VKILWHSNAPWAPTGYGQQTALHVPELRDLGHEMGISAFYGLQGGILNVDDIPIYPRGQDIWGNDILPAHAEHFGADIVITLMDVWVLRATAVSRIRWCPWLPVDHKPCPPPIARIAKLAYQPIAYSKFGKEQLEAAEVDAAYVPHGIDTELFQPGDKAEARKKMGLPEDVFLVGMVAANKGNAPSRKCFVEAMMGFKILHDRYQDTAIYIHSVTGTQHQGINLTELGEVLQIPEDAMYFADQYQMQVGYPNQYIRDAYNAMDVLLNPAMGEGFGLPIIEAQACGVPAIVTDWTAMSEVCKAGWKVSGRPFYTPMAAWMLQPNVAEIVDALDECYNLSDSAREHMAKKARVHARNYDVKHVAQVYWKPLLERIEGEISEGGELKMVSFA
jgi:glycosyltransferase involved in cell wall biosynthesis